nr:phospholipase-like protein [Tanacetum cinerariifolium]
MISYLWSKNTASYTKGFPERIKGNITSSRPTKLHDAINLARELVEQAVQGKAARINEAIKGNGKNTRKTTPTTITPTTVTATATTTINTTNRTGGRKLPGPMPQLQLREKDYRVRIPAMGGNTLQDVTCFVCVEKGHYRHKCPKRKNQSSLRGIDCEILVGYARVLVEVKAESQFKEKLIITIKAIIGATVKEIREALTETQVQIFKKTCLGHWIDISLKRNNQLLIHTLLTCMVDSVANGLSFLVSGKRIRFRRQEFCLVTGLRFGSNMYMKEWVKNMAENPFRNRVFPHIEAKSVKLSDVIAIFDKMRGKSLVLEDNDPVKICLLIWILEAIPATHLYVCKEPREKIPRAFAWKMILPFSWARCRTLFVGDNLSPPLETLTPTKSESESDWWKTSLEYFKGKDLQSEAVSEQLEIEKDALSEEVQKKKKRKRGSSPPSFQNPTYDQLMTTVKSRLLTLEGDARISTLTQTVSSLQGTIDNLKSRLLALEGDERDFGVVLDGDIPTYMSPGPSYTSPASIAQKSLPLANRRKLRVRRTLFKFKSPMRCYSRKMRCTIPLPASTTMPPITTILVPMTTTKLLKDTKDAAKDVTKDVAKDTISVPMTTTEKLKDTLHIDAPAHDTFCTEDELQFIGMEKGDKPNYDLPDLSKIKRNKYPIYSTFEKKKTNCYLDCLPKGRTCEPSFWEILYPGGEKVEYLNERKLDGLVSDFHYCIISTVHQCLYQAYDEMRPRNAQWTLGLSELVTFHIESRKLMSMVSVVDALRPTIDGTNLSCMRLLKAVALVVVVTCLEVYSGSVGAYEMGMLGGAAGVGAAEMGMIADAASSLAFKKHN